MTSPSNHLSTGPSIGGFILPDPRLTLIAGAAAMQRVLELIGLAGPSNLNVLLTGETGTGKGLTARILHAISPRAAHPLLTLEMGELPSRMLERELFGLNAGPGGRPGVLERAHRGTLLLDELGATPAALQPALARVIQRGEFERLGSCQSRTVDVRFFAATSSELGANVAAGRLGADLLRSLATIEVHLPPLRARTDDIPALADHFLRLHAARHNRAISGFDAAAHRLLLDHSWPGNIRELGRAIECAVLASKGRQIVAEDLVCRPGHDQSPRLDDLNLVEAQELLVRKALCRFDGRLAPAAKALGVSRAALIRLRRSFVRTDPSVFTHL